MKKFKALREAAALSVAADHIIKKKDDNNMSTNDVEFVDLHAVEVEDHPVATDAQFPNKEKKFAGLRKVKANEAFEKEDAGDFCMAAAAAKKEGKKKFIFAGKEYPVTIKTDIPVKEETETVNEDNVSDLRDIVKNKAMKSIKFADGKMKVDLFTASAVVQALDKVNPANKEKLTKLINTGKKAKFLDIQKLVMKKSESTHDDEEEDDDDLDEGMIMVADPKTQKVIKIDEKDWPKYEKKGYVQAESNNLEEAIKVGILKLNNGKSVKVSKEDAATLNSVLEDLNPSNRKRMEVELMKDEKSYKNMLTFAKRTD